MRKRAEYQEIQRTARRVSTPRFVLLLSARAEQDGTRLGIVVSRKIGCAVVRNRAKRLIREAFRATRELFGPDLDVVVIVKRSTGAAALAEIVAEWQAVARVLQKRTEDARADRARRDAAHSAPGAEAGEAREKARNSRGP